MEKEEIGDKKIQSNAKSVETYTDDMVKVLEDDQGSTIKKIIHEEEEREIQKKNLSPQSLKNRTFMTIGIILVILALGALASSDILVKKISTVPIKQPFQSLISTDSNSFNEISGLSDKEISAVVANKVIGTTVRQSEIEGIFLTNNGNELNFGSLISGIKGNFPSNAISFVNNFLLGAYNSGTSKDFFLFLKVSSFDDIFQPMQIWEKKMFSDLHGMLGIDITSDNSYLLTKSFEDGIVDNRNARILYDNSGNVVLMYVYADDTSVIISNSISASKEVINRINSAKVGK